MRHFGKTESSRFRCGPGRRCAWLMLRYLTLSSPEESCQACRLEVSGCVALRLGGFVWALTTI